MSETFRPEVWSQELLASMRRSIIYGIDPQRRLGHTKVTPYLKTELKARRKALKAWQALTDELLAKGWLEDFPYEGIFPCEDTEHREWVYDETEDEYQARLAALPPDTFTIPVKHGLNNDSLTIVREATA